MVNPGTKKLLASLRNCFNLVVSSFTEHDVESTLSVLDDVRRIEGSSSAAEHLSK